MTASSEVPAIVETVVRYECPKCGNNCQCGVPYVPKTMRAAEAIKANPEKSNRAIAAEFGVGKETVREARNELAATGQLEADAPRTGLDGKTRKQPSSKPKLNSEEEYTAMVERGLRNMARGVEPCNPETWHLENPSRCPCPLCVETHDQTAEAPPQYVVTKAELMPVLQTILKCCDYDSLDIPDADIELYDAVDKAEDVIRSLRFTVKRNDSVYDALKAREAIEQAEEKEPRKLARAARKAAEAAA
jgi:hypothetical protein